jgi:hypothetical protein
MARLSATVTDRRASGASGVSFGRPSRTACSTVPAMNRFLGGVVHTVAAVSTEASFPGNCDGVLVSVSPEPSQ